MFGHETSECQYRAGMTVAELASTTPQGKANQYHDAQIADPQPPGATR